MSQTIHVYRFSVTPAVPTHTAAFPTISGGDCPRGKGINVPQCSGSVPLLWWSGVTEGWGSFLMDERSEGLPGNLSGQAPPTSLWLEAPLTQLLCPLDHEVNTNCPPSGAHPVPPHPRPAVVPGDSLPWADRQMACWTAWPPSGSKHRMLVLFSGDQVHNHSTEYGKGGGGASLLSGHQMSAPWEYRFPNGSQGTEPQH